MSVNARSNGNGTHLDVVASARALSLWRGGRIVLEVDRLDIGTGVTSLVGPNGSGKSTLLHALAGLLAPRDGTLRVFGSDPRAVRRHIGYVMQAQHAPTHLPVTVREVVGLGRAAQRGAFGRFRDADRVAIQNAIDRVGLGRLANRHLAELSGGERQRAFVAQGLAQGASLLLLDEPTSGLDLTSSDRIREVLSDERSLGHAVVVATHDLAEAANSDQVALLAGRVVVSGPPGTVLVRRHLAAAYGGRVLSLDGEMLLVDDDAHHHSGRPDVVA